MIFTLKEIIKIGEWVKKKFNGEFYLSFVQGFEGRYIIIETNKDCREGRTVYKIEEILSEEEE